MKKTMAVLMTLVMALTMCSCGQKDQGGSQEATPDAAPAESGSEGDETADAAEGGSEKTVTIGDYTFTIDTAKDPKDLEIPVVYQNVQDIFASYMEEGVLGFAEEKGINAYVTGSNDWSAESQYNLMETLVTKKPDAIAIAAADDQTLTPVINKALEAGIPVLCVNCDAPSSGRLAYLGRDDVEAGREVAKYIVEKLTEKYGEPKGKILMTTTGAGNNWSDQREAGNREIFEQYPDIEIVDFINATGDEQSMYGMLENALLANPDIDAMCNMGGTMDLWGRLMKNQGRTDIIAVGNDLYGDVLSYIKDGYLTCSYGQRVYEQCYGGVEQLYNFLTTGDPASFKENDVPFYIFRVDAANVDEVLEQRESGTPIG